MWALVAMLAVGLVVCSKDEPTPNPDTEQEDPSTDQGSGTGGQDADPVEDWQDEKPHGFYFELDSIYLPLSEDGFVKVWDRYHRDLSDSIVMEKRSRRTNGN